MQTFPTNMHHNGHHIRCILFTKACFMFCAPYDLVINQKLFKVSKQEEVYTHSEPSHNPVSFIDLPPSLRRTTVPVPLNYF